MLYLKRLAHLYINALSLNTKFKKLYKYIKINRKYDFNEIYKLTIHVLIKNVHLFCSPHFLRTLFNRCVFMFLINFYVC